MFTGDGVEVAGEVETVARPDPLLTIAVAPPKGDRLEWLVAKCTEVGIDRIVLLEAEHSVVRWTGERLERQLERLRRIAVEASMQSRRVWLPEISGPLPAVEVLPEVAVAEPGGRPVQRSDTGDRRWPGGRLVAEGAGGRGLDGCRSARNVLRVETAAVAAAVLMVSHR